MSSSAKYFDGDLPEWLRLSVAEIDGTDFNRLVLLVLRCLDAEFPKRVDLSDCGKLKERIGEFGQIWDWLEAQQIVSGPMSNCSLTLSGRQSYQQALELASISARLLLRSKEGLTGSDAREVVFRILRQHYHNYVERTEGR